MRLDKSFDMKTKYLRKWVTSLHGQEWKDVRTSLTPAFSTGKIKRVINNIVCQTIDFLSIFLFSSQMSFIIKECVDNIAKKFEVLAAEKGKMDAKQ